MMMWTTTSVISSHDSAMSEERGATRHCHVAAKSVSRGSQVIRHVINLGPIKVPRQRTYSTW